MGMVLAEKEMAVDRNIFGVLGLAQPNLKLGGWRC